MRVDTSSRAADNHRLRLAQVRPPFGVVHATGNHQVDADRLRTHAPHAPAAIDRPGKP